MVLSSLDRGWLGLRWEKLLLLLLGFGEFPGFPGFPVLPVSTGFPEEDPESHIVINQSKLQEKLALCEKK